MASLFAKPFSASLATVFIGSIAHSITDNEPRFVQGTVIVRYETDCVIPARELGEMAAVLAEGRVRHYSEFVPGLSILSVPPGREEEALEQCSRLPGLRYAVRDTRSTMLSTDPNDPYFAMQWQFKNTGQSVNGVSGIAGADVCAQGAWAVRKYAGSVIVAVIDTGFIYTHDDLAYNIWSNPNEVDNEVDDDLNGYVNDFVGIRLNDCDEFYMNVDPWEAREAGEHDPSSGGNHGTAVASMLGMVGDNELLGTGAAWQVRIMPLAQLDLVDAIPCGSLDASTAIIGFEYAKLNGARIVNCSWGFRAADESQALYDAFAYLESAGVLAVVAAGNDGEYIDAANPPSHTMLYPALYEFENLLIVGASDQCNHRASFSNWGETSVDIYAPGVNLVTFPGNADCPASNGNHFCSGTSYAAPIVAGFAALIMAQNPTWSAVDVKNQIINTAFSISCLSGLCVSGGTLNAAAALGATCSHGGVCCGE